MKLLLADDSRTIRMILRDLLGQLHISDVTEAANGREAIDLLAQGQYDLILLDIHMPEADGLTVLEYAKKNPDSTHREVPVMIISSDSDYRQIQRARDLGAYGFVKKPFKRDVLAGAVEAARRTRENADSPTGQRSQP